MNAPMRNGPCLQQAFAYPQFFMWLVSTLKLVAYCHNFVHEEHVKLLEHVVGIMGMSKESHIHLFGTTALALSMYRLATVPL